MYSKSALLCLALVFFTSPSLAAHAGDQRSIIVGGTGVALGGVRLVAREFAKIHPEIKVTVLPSIGSGGGVRALVARKVNIALTARYLKDEEEGKGLVVTEYARTPLVFATRYDTAASDVKVEQLAPIYHGSADWPDGSRLRLIMRPPSEFDNELLGSISPDIKAAVETAMDREEQFVAMTDQENATALERVPGAFGMTTLAQVLSEQRTVKVMTFNGVAASVRALETKRYPYEKCLFHMVRSDATADTKAFIEFLHSDIGQRVLKANGHLTVRMTY